MRLINQTNADHCIILRTIVSNVEKVIIGKREVIELAVCAFICKGHALIEDVPGVGKTSLVSALARSFSCSFRRIQFTSDILPSDITGFSMYNQKIGDFEYKEGAIMSQIILADEINRTPPKTQSSLLEIMEENQVTVDGKTYQMPKPFIVLATQNPVEYLGTFPLPEAQLDRFFMKISIGYPDAIAEKKMLSLNSKGSFLKKLTPVANAEDLLMLQEKVQDIYVDDKIKDYIIEIIRNTRDDKNILLGASPRATLCLCRAAQAWALYNERDFVCPDDVIKMVKPVVAHRLVLTQEAKFQKISAEQIIEKLVKNIKIPY